MVYVERLEGKFQSKQLLINLDKNTILALLLVQILAKKF